MMLVLGKSLGFLSQLIAHVIYREGVFFVVV